MKQTICLISIVLGLITVASAPTSPSDGSVGSITAAADALFGADAALGAVTVDSLSFGTGVFIEPDGSATGTFHALLAGHSFLLQHQEISVDGKVSAGAGDSGSGSFSGTATVDLGEGLPLLGVPFHVTITANSIVLSLDGTILPAADVNSGAIAIE